MARAATLALLGAAGVSAAPCAPEQFFINYAEKPSQMRVSWATACEATASVSYGLSPSSLKTVVGPAPTQYTTPFYTSPFLYHTTLEGLNTGTTYYYTVGDATSGVSDVFNFTSHPGVGPEIPHVFAILGDPGQTANSASTFAHVAASNANSAVIVGDLSYADSDQPRWDSWAVLISSLTARMPTMTLVGNHEIELTGFTAYASRMAMPAPANGPNLVWYSQDVASAHWIYLSNYHPFTAGSDQFKWLEADLAAIDRSVTPWVFVNTHAPFYNSNKAHQGDGEGMRVALETMLYNAGVDAMFFGHVHSYERNHRVYNKARDIKGPVMVNCGDAGNREGLYTSWLPTPDYSAFHQSTYGHFELSIFNSTHAYGAWKANPDSETIVRDSVWIIKGEDA